jgi:phospholipid-binding lipoprotein MlaA
MRLKSELAGRLSAIGLVVALALSACATPTADDPDARTELTAINDPWEPFNRAVFEFNRVLDRALLRPVAQVYRGVIPELGREMVKNFLDNLRSPVILVNDILQGEMNRASETGTRFLANTTVGLGGLFDVTDIEFHSEDFGQTLAVWGFEEGPYLVLPLLGPSPIRDTIGLIGDSFLDPVTWYTHRTDRHAISWVRYGMRAVDRRSRNIETLDEIERSAIDLYATVRSLYRQRRSDEVLNGRPPQSVTMPEISWDEDETAEENQVLVVTK